ncbi:MAG: dipeptide epimerase [Alphaproteobacteria bacterium]|nr:dipeptide epimerase [Alphaproteobacteria bacterium]
MRGLSVRQDEFPIQGSFTISRGSRTAVQVLVAEIIDGDCRGLGECVPYARYGEGLASVRRQIEGVRPALADGLDRQGLADALPPGAARNALDCALFDLEAKQGGRRAWEIAGLPAPGPLTTAFTLSLDSPAAMARAARAAAGRSLLKLKLGGDGDVERVAAVRQAAPGARIIVDANEAWSPAMLAPFSRAWADLRVELIEQPLPAGGDEVLAATARPVPVCADESCHHRGDLDRLAGRYDFVNVKLDKTGGLTEALALVRQARQQGFGVMVGCMLATSLAMAPATLIGGLAEFVDLDGPLLLATDRDQALVYRGDQVEPPTAALWG